MTEKTLDPHLVREWEQAWGHYRHLESSRGQYLGFFFTALVASVGLAIGLIKDVRPDQRPTVVLGLTVLALVDYLIAIGLFTAIKKTGYVLKRYETIMNTVRERAGFRSSKELPFDLTDTPGYPGVVLDSGLFSVQRSAEAILGVASFVLAALLGALAILMFTSTIAFERWHQVLGAGTAGVAIAYLAAVFGSLAIGSVKRPKSDSRVVNGSDSGPARRSSKKAMQADRPPAGR